MVISKLTRKAQTTVPGPVRAALRLMPGDEIVYTIEGDRVVLTRRSGVGAGDDPFGGFEEWAGEADTRAYAGL